MPSAMQAYEAEAIGGRMMSCGVGPRRCGQQVTVAGQRTDERIQPLVFAWLIGGAGEGGHLAVWRFSTVVLVTRGIAVDAGTAKPIAASSSACTSGHCVATANLASELMHDLIRETRPSPSIHSAEVRVTGNVNNELAMAVYAEEASMAG